MYINILQNIKLLETNFKHQNSLWYTDRFVLYMQGYVDEVNKLRYK